MLFTVRLNLLIFLFRTSREELYIKARCAARDEGWKMGVECNTAVERRSEEGSVLFYCREDARCVLPSLANVNNPTDTLALWKDTGLRAIYSCRSCT